MPEVRHLEYPEIAKRLTPEKQIKEKLAKIRASNDPVKEMVGMFPTVFEGIGCHKYRQVKLEIDETVKPVVQAKRRIPFPKREKLDEVLQELDEEDITEEVTGPTEWISNLVLTPKADQKLRMNIDMTTANDAIKRTRHVIPTLEEVKYNLNGAKFFSKLVMKQGT